MSSIMGQFGPDQLELFALELGKIAAFDFVYFLASTNINQSVPFVEENVTMSSIIKSCIVFCAKPKEVGPIELISLRQISLSIALKYMINNSV